MWYFSQLVIGEANWLTLPSDLGTFEEAATFPKAGFDAIICLGNSFAHMLDHDGTQENQKTAIKNFYSQLRPGGLLIIDHRNYDAMLKLGRAPAGKNVYYQASDYDCSESQRHATSFQQTASVPYSANRTCTHTNKCLYWSFWYRV